jgi:hypothetical protein
MLANAAQAISLRFSGHIIREIWEKVMSERPEVGAV